MAAVATKALNAATLSAKGDFLTVLLRWFCLVMISRTTFQAENETSNVDSPEIGALRRNAQIELNVPEGVEKFLTHQVRVSISTATARKAREEDEKQNGALKQYATASAAAGRGFGRRIFVVFCVLFLENHAGLSCCRRWAEKAKRAMKQETPRPRASTAIMIIR